MNKKCIIIGILLMLLCVNLTTISIGEKTEEPLDQQFTYGGLGIPVSKGNEEHRQGYEYYIPIVIYINGGDTITLRNARQIGFPSSDVHGLFRFIGDMIPSFWIRVTQHTTTNYHIIN